MLIVKRALWCFTLMFLLAGSVFAEKRQPPLPAAIGGTVTVDGVQLTQSTAAAYSFSVTKQDGTAYNPKAETTGLNASDMYLIKIPTYDATDQPGGANPGDTATLHVFKNGAELNVTSPTGGELTVGEEGSSTPTAIIAATTQTHTVTFTAGSGGTLTGTTTQTVNHGADCTPVEAVANAGNEFTGWSGDQTGTDNPLTVTNVTADMNITANFTSSTYTVTFTAGSGGTLTGTTTQTVNHGADCTPVKAVANAGNEFTGWSGDQTGTDNPLTVTNVTADMNITANFTNNTYTVTFTAGSGGSLTGTTTQTVNHGANCTPVTAVPNAGNEFTGWSGDQTGTDNPLTVTNVTADMNIKAIFAAIISGGPADGAALAINKGNFKNAPTSANAPAGAPATFPFGLLNFTIEGLAVGATVDVVITMPGNIPAGAVYYKYQNGQFSQFNNVTGLDDGDRTFTVTITDGGPGDEDGLANGKIVEPGGPAVSSAPIPTLNEWGMIVFMALFSILAIHMMRKKEREF